MHADCEIFRLERLLLNFEMHYNLNYVMNQKRGYHLILPRRRSCVPKNQKSASPRQDEALTVIWPVAVWTHRSYSVPCVLFQFPPCGEARPQHPPVPDGYRYVGSLLFKSREKQEADARASLENHLHKSIDRICSLLEDQMIRKFDDLISVCVTFARSSRGNWAFLFLWTRLA